MPTHALVGPAIMEPSCFTRHAPFPPLPPPRLSHLSRSSPPRFPYFSLYASSPLDPPASTSPLPTTVPPLLSTLTLTLLRLLTASLMFHHGLDKLSNVEGFSLNVVEKFFAFLPGPSPLWTLSAAYTQVICSVTLSLGALTRLSSFSLFSTMAFAVIFHLQNTGLEGYPLSVVEQHSYNFELASMYVGVLGLFAVKGGGGWSVDEKLLGGEIEFYSSVLKRLFGEGEGEEAEDEKVEGFKFPWLK
ncbi:hypothetical protein TrVE_jg1726 [Triparma verrucosa]|uniref:DoxX family protein n=1 Tax=Triparma verrucosa TaxID=1606542 RepID=A0A9W7BD74_9STRA|nr:hypothetical protein TrVE_jg1726 [Triparma verrucosa]